MEHSFYKTSNDDSEERHDKVTSLPSLNNKAANKEETTSNTSDIQNQNVGGKPS